MIDNLLKSIKIWVSGVGESTSVQEVLFKHGVKWISFKDQNIRFTTMPFLYVSSIGYMQYSWDANMFDGASEREVTAEEIINYGKAQQVEPQNLNQEVNSMDIKKLLAEIEAKKNRKEKIVEFLGNDRYKMSLVVNVHRLDHNDNYAFSLYELPISKDQIIELVKAELAEVDAFLSKYQPLIDTFNAAIKGAGND